MNSNIKISILKRIHLLMVVGIPLLFSITTLAQDKMGGGSTGGGDPCEMRIQIIRDDISNWIQRGGPNYKLILPEGISVSQYSEKMLQFLGSQKRGSGILEQKTDIECVHRNIQVEGHDKICQFEIQNSRPKISCNYESFMNEELTPPAEQYRLIHHEYAGIAGLEKPKGSQSEYFISNQITKYLESQVITKLAIKDPIESYDCYKFEGEIIKCSEEQLLTAFHQLQNMEHTSTKSLTKDIVRNGAKVLVTAGSITFVMNFFALFAEHEHGPVARAFTIISRGLFGNAQNFGGFFFGGLGMITGGMTLVLSPTEMADSTLTGYLSSDEGTAKLLKLTDEEFIQYARLDSKVSLRVMQIHAAIASVELIHKMK